MKRICFWVILLLVLGFAKYGITATKVLSEDCEATNFAQHFLENHYGTGTLAYWNTFKSCMSRDTIAHNGSYSMKYDPFSCGNPHAVVGYGSAIYGNTSHDDFSTITSNIWYFRWYQRWQTGINWGGECQNKIFYLNYGDSGDTTYVIQRNGSNNFHIEVKHNAPSYDYTCVPASQCAGCEGNAAGTNPITGGACSENRSELYTDYQANLDDANWHKMEVYINFGTTGHTDGSTWMKVDGTYVYNWSGIALNQTIHSNPVAFLTGWPSNISGTCSGSGTTWLDDLEIWINGTPLDPPQNFHKE